MNLNQYLTEAESRYDAQCQMLGAPFHGPGYHSHVPEGTWTHATRESADYALALLESGTQANRRRAALVIARILALQQRDSTASTYGIWPWLLEESLAEMDPPDWNWADFIGARLAQILVQYEADLPEPLRRDTRIALGHAAWSIFRRNVQSNYTNIAIMGAGVALVAGEILALPQLFDYGRQRLANMVAYVQDQGNFNEYNSPTYTIVAIHETERILQLVHDPAARAAAEWIRTFAWQTTLAHFHPQTSQWAPPHARAYHDHLPPEAAAYLAASTGLAVRSHDGGVSRISWSPITHLPAPASAIEQCRSFPATGILLRERFIRRDPEADSSYATTWMAEKACFGSMNRSIFWTQHRPLQGYLWTPTDPAVVVRVQALHDGRDFCAISCRSVQEANRVLTVFNMTHNTGDFHPSLDRPKNGCFRVQDLRIRYLLSGTAVAAQRVADGTAVLTAGPWRVVIHAAAEGSFGGRPIRWQIVTQKDQVWFDAVLYTGEPMDFSVETAGPLKLAASLEILGPEESMATQPPVVVYRNARTVEAHWLANLQVVAPAVEAQ